MYEPTRKEILEMDIASALTQSLRYDGLSMEQLVGIFRAVFNNDEIVKFTNKLKKEL